MKIFLLISTGILFLSFAACSTMPANQAVNSANSANQVTNAATGAPANSRLPDSNRSPMDTLRALNVASKAKNADGIKNLVSSGSMKIIELSAKNQNKTVDELLTEEDGAPFKDLPEMRNEKIDGDKATVEVKNAMTKEFDAIPFVRENGEWKVALDVLVEELERKATEEMKKMPDNSKTDKK